MEQIEIKIETAIVDAIYDVFMESFKIGVYERWTEDPKEDIKDVIVKEANRILRCMNRKGL